MPHQQLSHACLRLFGNDKALEELFTLRRQKQRGDPKIHLDFVSKVFLGMRSARLLGRVIF